MRRQGIGQTPSALHGQLCPKPGARRPRGCYEVVYSEVQGDVQEVWHVV